MTSLAKSEMEGRIVWMDNARIVSMFAVVLIHVAAYTSIKSEVGAADWWAGVGYNALARWCVPVFVMMSGALLLEPNRTECFQDFYRKRFAKIFFPLVFWSIVFCGWTNVKGIFSHNAPPLGLFKSLISGTPYYHMWFLYVIAMLYLFTPFFRKVTSNASKKELIFLLVVLFLIAMLNALLGLGAQTLSPSFFGTRFLSFVPFFLCGYLVGMVDIKVSKAAVCGALTASVLLTIAGVYFLSIQTDAKTGNYFNDYLSVTVVPMSLCTLYLLRFWGKPILNASAAKKLSSLTLGVYLIHPIILDVLNYLKAGPLDYNSLLSIPLLAVLIFALSFTSAWLLGKVPYLSRTI